MKKIATICILFFTTINFSFSQNLKVLKQVENQLKSIKSGDYTLTKSFQLKDKPPMVNEKLLVQFYEFGNTTTCIINDLLKNEILFFDTTEWVSIYSKNDSIMRKYVRYNPNQNLLYKFLQSGSYYKINILKEKRIKITADKENYIIMDTISFDEFNENSFKFIIDKKLLIPTHYSFIETVEVNPTYIYTQKTTDEIANVKLNNYTQAGFLKVLNDKKSELSVKKIIYPEYERALKK